MIWLFRRKLRLEHNKDSPMFREVAKSLASIIKEAKRHVAVTVFASNVARIRAQQRRQARAWQGMMKMVGAMNVRVT